MWFLIHVEVTLAVSSTADYLKFRDGAQHPYATMPLQDLHIGPLEILRVSFFTLSGARKDFDGLLSTGLFRRVFICHTRHFVVLDPR
jgi:hypothetical protein